MLLKLIDAGWNWCIVSADSIVTEATSAKINDAILMRISKRLISHVLWGILILSFSLNITASASLMNYSYLPAVLKGFPPKIIITTIFYDGVKQNEPDEYVEIRNDDTSPVQLIGWTVQDISGHIYTFPSFIIQPNQVCRVYTYENHPEWCGFTYNRSSPVWNNSGDCAYLHDSTGTPIDEYCY